MPIGFIGGGDVYAPVIKTENSRKKILKPYFIIDNLDPEQMRITLRHTDEMFGIVFDYLNKFVTDTEIIPVLYIRVTSSPLVVEEGGILTYTIEYWNSGKDTAMGIVIKETYDANVAFVSADPAPDVGTNDTWTIGTVTTGKKNIITITVIVDSSVANGTVIHNVVSIKSDTTEVIEVSADSVVVNYTSLRARGIDFPIFGSDESVVIGDGILPAVMPLALNGKNLTYAIAGVDTKGSANTTDVQIRRVRAGIPHDMLSTKITIATTEYFAKDGVINISYDDILEGDLIYIDVDAVGTGTKGLTVTLVFE